MHRQELAPRNRAKLLGLAIALGLCLTGCGDSGTAPTPVPPQTTTTIFSDTFVGIGDQVALAYDFTVSAAGTLTVVVDWTHASNNISVFLTIPSCTIDMLNARTCQFFATDTGVTKPKRIESGGFQPGSYRVWIGNDGPGSESGVVNVLLTR